MRFIEYLNSNSIFTVKPEKAEKIYNAFVSAVKKEHTGGVVQTGTFGALMQVSLVRILFCHFLHILELIFFL